MQTVYSDTPRCPHFQSSEASPTPNVTCSSASVLGLGDFDLAVIVVNVAFGSLASFNMVSIGTE